MYTYGPNYGEKLFVGNLPFNASDAEIWSLFSSFGQVVEVVLLGSNKSKSGQGCAFVRFADHECAVNAINHLDGRVALRPHEEPELLLQVRPARSNGHPGLQAYPSSAPGSMYMNIGHVSTTATMSESSKMTSYEVYQPVLPQGSVRLFVGNIPLEVTAFELNEIFRQQGISLYESETFIMTGSRSSHNSICAFIVVSNEEESNKAIDLINNKVCMRPGSLCLKVKIANQTAASGNKATGRRPRSHSDTMSVPPPPPPPPTSMPGSGMHHHGMIDTRFFHNSTSGEYIDWKEPSIKTYHAYMMMPQSSHYGPLNIIPGNEPWRNNGIYSLPPSSYTPFMGH
jgi:RNA recognition motif-containing protein